MALIKCPDCEKMISERAASCPYCGCPAEFFAVEKVKTSSKDKAALNDILRTLCGQIEFKLAGHTISYLADTEFFANSFGTFTERSLRAMEAMNELYVKSGGIATALKNSAKLAQNITDEVIEDCMHILYTYNINFTKEQFVEKYFYEYKMDYSEFFTPVVERFAKIKNQESDLKLYREAQKANRGRWQGGGFGVSGAIKGAVKASVLNVGSDFIHFFGDSADKYIDNIEIRSKLQDLYKNPKTKEILCEGIKICVINAYWALITELIENNAIQMIEIDSTKAEALFTNTLKYTQNDEEKIKNIVQCIEYYPGEKKYYDEIMDEIIKCDAGNDFEDFLNFWNLKFLYPNYMEEREEEERRKKEEKKQRLKEKEERLKFDIYFGKVIKEMEQLETLGEKYGKFRGSLCTYMKENNLKEVPTQSNYYSFIRDFWVTVSLKNNEEVIKSLRSVEWIPLDCNAIEFMQYIAEDRKKLLTSLIGCWMIGDNENKYIYPTEKIKDEIEKDHETILLYYDTSFFKTGKKGILITTHYIMDLKEKNKINLKDVTQIDLYEGAIEIHDNEKSILWSGEIFEDIAQVLYVNAVLLVYCVRYGNNARVWCDGMATPKPEKVSLKECPKCGFELESDMTYCPLCGAWLQGEEK